MEKAFLGLHVVGRVAARVNIRKEAILQGAFSPEKGVSGLCIVCLGMHEKIKQVKHLAE